MTLSARNHLKGTIEEIQLGDVLAHITVRVGDSVIESVITRRSAEEMGLTKGDSVTAVVKATEVMIAKPVIPRLDGEWRSLSEIAEAIMRARTATSCCGGRKVYFLTFRSPIAQRYDELRMKS